MNLWEWKSNEVKSRWEDCYQDCCVIAMTRFYWGIHLPTNSSGSAVNCSQDKMLARSGKGSPLLCISLVALGWNINVPEGNRFQHARICTQGSLSVKTGKYDQSSIPDSINLIQLPGTELRGVYRTWPVGTSILLKLALDLNLRDNFAPSFHTTVV